MCFVCSVYTTPSEMFTCRVCMKSFHEGCLQKLGELSTEVGKLHAKLISKSAIGWSCYKCVSKPIKVSCVYIQLHECIKHARMHAHQRTHTYTNKHMRAHKNTHPRCNCTSFKRPETDHVPFCVVSLWRIRFPNFGCFHLITGLFTF